MVELDIVQRASDALGRLESAATITRVLVGVPIYTLTRSLYYVPLWVKPDSSLVSSPEGDQSSEETKFRTPYTNVVKIGNYYRPLTTDTTVVGNKVDGSDPEIEGTQDSWYKAELNRRKGGISLDFAIVKQILEFEYASHYSAFFRSLEELGLTTDGTLLFDDGDKFHGNIEEETEWSSATGKGPDEVTSFTSSSSAITKTSVEKLISLHGRPPFPPGSYDIVARLNHEGLSDFTPGDGEHDLELSDGENAVSLTSGIDKTTYKGSVTGAISIGSKAYLKHKFPFRRRKIATSNVIASTTLGEIDEFDFPHSLPTTRNIVTPTAQFVLTYNPRSLRGASTITASNIVALGPGIQADWYDIRRQQLWTIAYRGPNYPVHGASALTSVSDRQIRLSSLVGGEHVERGDVPFARIIPTVRSFKKHTAPINVRGKYPVFSNPRRTSPQAILYRPVVSYLCYIPLERRKTSGSGTVFNRNIYLYYINGTFEYDLNSEIVTRDMIGFMAVQYTNQTIPTNGVPSVTTSRICGVVTPHDEDTRASFTQATAFADQNWHGGLPYTLGIIPWPQAVRNHNFASADVNLNVGSGPIYGSASQLRSSGWQYGSILGIASSSSTRIPASYRTYDVTDTEDATFPNPNVRLSAEVDFALEKVIRDSYLSTSASSVAIDVPDLSTSLTGYGALKYGLQVERAVIGDIPLRPRIDAGFYLRSNPGVRLPDDEAAVNYASSLTAPFPFWNRLDLNSRVLSPNSVWCVPRFGGRVIPTLLGYAYEREGTADPGGSYSAKVVLTRR